MRGGLNFLGCTLTRTTELDQESSVLLIGVPEKIQRSQRPCSPAFRHELVLYLRDVYRLRPNRLMIERYRSISCAFK